MLGVLVCNLVRKLVSVGVKLWLMVCGSLYGLLGCRGEVKLPDLTVIMTSRGR